MPAYSGFVKGVNLIASSRGAGAHKVYEVTLATTHAVVPGDTVVVTGVPTRIQEMRKSGRTFNYINSIGLNPVVDASGNSIAIGGTAVANSSGTLTFYFVTDPGTTAATATILEGVSLLVVGYDS